MKLAIMQPYFFPYIGYFQLYCAVDKFVFLDDANFIKKGWINRNRILIHNQPELITVSLVKASQNKKIKEILIFEHSDWRKNMLMTIERAYARSDYFNDVFPVIESVIFDKTSDISSLAQLSIRSVCDYLSLMTRTVESTEIYSNSHLKGENRIIDIIKRENCNEYFNLIGGMDLYSKDIFNQNGIQLFFMSPNIIRYKQFDNEFSANLSIIDVMMFNPIETVHKFLNMYSLT